jgi:hypothetical protein
MCSQKFEMWCALQTEICIKNTHTAEINLFMYFVYNLISINIIQYFISDHIKIKIKDIYME